MFEVANEYDVTIVSEIGHQNRCVVIVDNFYKDPDSVRDFCLSSPKYSREDKPWLVGGLCGTRVLVETPEVRECLKKTFTDFVSIKNLWLEEHNQEQWDKNWNRTNFMCNVMNDESMGKFPMLPHQDSFDVQYGAVIYLNTPEECAGGTDFYSYMGKTTLDVPKDGGLMMWQKNTEGITAEEWVEGKDNRWKVEFEAEMKYNRMVLYEASILHMQNWKEGMFPTYDRINQVFFL